MKPEVSLTDRCFALIPCAGTGSRAGTAQPKQYQPVAGQAMVHHTLDAFLKVPRIDLIQVVVAPDDQFLGLSSARLNIARCGGQSRAESVFNGLNALLSSGAHVQDWVLVHDAARCLIEPAQINALMDACLADEVGGLLALPLADTLKCEQEGRVDETLDRTHKWLAQTPQMFRIGLLHEALAGHVKTAFAGITDEASAVELHGARPKLVLGSASNFKVTYPDDFELAEAILKSRRT